MFVFVFEGALFALTYNGDRFVLFTLLPRRKPRTGQCSCLVSTSPARGYSDSHAPWRLAWFFASAGRGRPSAFFLGWGRPVVRPARERLLRWNRNVKDGTEDGGMDGGPRSGAAVYVSVVALRAPLFPVSSYSTMRTQVPNARLRFVPEGAMLAPTHNGDRYVLYTT